MNERAVTFGPDGILVGIVTEPDPEHADPSAPGHVILNSGILHRVGASRIYVQIARELARQGFTTLRFDFSGVGDSGTRRDSLAIEERFIRETQEAMDHLVTTRGMERFVLGGLCSGADGAFWAALEDERAVGVWQIDPFTYPTFGHYIRRFAPKILDPRAWLHSVRVRMPAPEDSGDDDSGVFVAPEYRRVFPPHQVVQDGLGRLLERDARLYFFLTGDAGVNYAGQHADAFRRISLGTKATIDYAPEAQHIVTGLDHQRFFLDRLSEWMAAFRSGTVSAPALAGQTFV